MGSLMKVSTSKHFAVWPKLAEIFIVQCDFTAKITHPSSVTNFPALQVCQTHTGKTRQCIKKKNVEIRNGMTCRGCALQKCFNLIDRKGFDFFAEPAGKIPSISPFYPWNRSVRECSFAIFDPIFVKPPSGARISMLLLLLLSLY